jgi:hypothetical protein
MIFILNPKTKNNSKHKVMHSYLVRKLKLTSTRMNAYLLYMLDGILNPNRDRCIDRAIYFIGHLISKNGEIHNKVEDIVMICHK